MLPQLTPTLTPEHHGALDEVYHATRDVRVRTRAQMVLLAVEQRLSVAEIAAMVRESEERVRRWLKRFQAEGIAGRYVRYRGGAPRKVTPAYREQVLFAVRRRPRSLGLPFSRWTLQRLAEYLGEQTGIRVQDETVRSYLKAEDIVLSRPQHPITSPDPEDAVKQRRSKRRATS
jgi:transposase